MPRCPHCAEENPPGARFCMSCGAPMPAATAWGSADGATARETRRTVTALCAAVPEADAAYASLDAEALHELTGHFRDWAATVIERHGGRVLEGVTAEVCGVFGFPVAREDDALRAVHAAAELQAGVDELSAAAQMRWAVTAEIGVAIVTGEVVAREGADAPIPSGGAVAEARRLQRVAREGDILLDDTTHQLVGRAVTVELLAPQAVPGVAGRRECWRLIEVTGDELPRRHDVPFVDREAELSALDQAFDRAVSGPAPQLVTVLGVAGAGKSRLMHEFLTGIPEATILSGRCRDTRHGLTYWPLAEVVRQAAGPGPGDETALAERLAAQLPPAHAVHARTLAALAAANGAPGSREDLVGAVTALFAGLARSAPLVVVLEDLHWAPEPLLDLVAGVQFALPLVPVVICAVARPDLLDRRPDWGASRADSLTLTLGMLSTADARALVDGLLSGPGADQLRARVVATAEGNPLFLEELVHQLVEDGMLARDDGEWVATGGAADVLMPASVSALLAARLDHLAAGERYLLSVAAVVGRSVAITDLAALLSEHERSELPTRISSLVRQGHLVVDDPPAGTTYRFRHQLTRDAAYHRLPLRERAELHEKYARWLQAADAVDRSDEVVGYHLERSCRFRVQVGALDAAALDLAGEAAALLAGAGRRAFGRRDMVTAADLLGRAAALCLGQSAQRAELLPDLAAALVETGHFDRAAEVLTEAVTTAGGAGDSTALDRAIRVRAVLQRLTHPADPALDFGLAGSGPATSPGGVTDWTLVQSVIPADEASPTGAPQDVRLLLDTTPIAEGIRICLRALADAGDNATAQARALVVLAGLHAMQGRADKARRLLGSALDILTGLGLAARAADLGVVAGLVELLARDPGRAVGTTAPYLELAERMGNEYVASRLRAVLARAHRETGDLDEADRLATRSERSAAADDLATLALARATRGRVAAARGEGAAAVQLAREAVWTTEGGDLGNLNAIVLLDLATVLTDMGRSAEAAQVARDALARFEAKGNTVGATAAQRLLAPLTP